MDIKQYLKKKSINKQKRQILRDEDIMLGEAYIKSKTNLEVGDQVFYKDFGGKKIKTTIRNILVKKGEVIIYVLNESEDGSIPLMIDEVYSRKRKIETLLNS